MYSDFYGLNERPFQLTPDPRYYFESATHRKAMAYLGFGLAQGEGFIVITGDVGAGKSTLVSHLLSTIDRSKLHVVTIASTQLEGDDLLRVIAGQIGIATDGIEKGQVLGRIGKFLEDSAKSGKRTLVIVDEAQNLPFAAIEELRMLSNFTADEQPLVQIFLLGQPEFRDALQGSERLEQLRQRVIATHHLVPMNREESEAYVKHRLARAGWKGNPEITRDAFAALYDATGGVPRRINTLVSRVLLAGSIEQKKLIDGAMVREVVADMEQDAAVPEGERTVPMLAETLAEKLGDHRPQLVTPIRADPDTHLLRRVGLLEERLLEQEAMLRRALVLMVGIVEQDSGSGAAKERARPSAA